MDHDRPASKSTQTAASSRRDFIRDVGGMLFAVTVIDIADASFFSGQAFAQSSGCGQGVVDGSCTATASDANCGFTITATGTMDPDEGCRLSTDTDQACGMIAKDVDQACTAGSVTTSADEDQNCGKPYSTPGLNDADESCTTTSTDDNCSVNDNDESCNATSADESCNDSAATTSHNVDQSCTAVAADKDEACGVNSTGGARDEDQHCGKPASGSTDADEACGLTYTSVGFTYTDPDNAV